MLYTSDIEVCILVTLKGVDELRAHRAHHISLTQRIILRALSACYFALSARNSIIMLITKAIRSIQVLLQGLQSLAFL